MEYTSALISFLIIIIFSSISCSAAAAKHVLLQGSFLSVENQDDVLLSPNGVFSAGFHAVGANAYCFAVWFTQPPHRHNHSPTVVWMANRDEPVNGKKSTLSLQKTGKLILEDGGEFIVWTTETSSPHSPVNLVLSDTGNLVLQTETGDGSPYLWQSFDSPTDTLLPQQIFTRQMKLVSSRSEGNTSSGYYKMFFDNDNTIHLLYDGPDYSSIYWPNPRKVSWDNGRTSYNSTRIAMLDSLGQFNASDSLGFRTSDYQTVLQRRLTIDYDGNVRVYSRNDWTEEWHVSWQQIPQPCLVHGICGANSTCSYHPVSGRKCSCLPGYKRRNGSDWSQGCDPKPDFRFDNNKNGSYYFLLLPHFDFYGNDVAYLGNGTFQQCVDLCLQHYNCRSFQYKFIDGQFNCYPKFSLLNGFQAPDFPGGIYLKVPISYSNLTLAEALGNDEKLMNTACNSSETVLIERTYTKSHVSGKVKLLLWFARVFGAVEVICVLLVWGFLIRTRSDSDEHAQGYFPVGTGFRKYRYSELKKATRNFSAEIGRGSDGIVYKGELPVHDTVAIKRLREANQGNPEFLDEVSIIGKLNHMNLIKMWGYCAEGEKHVMLVYEYMEKGSLAENLGSNALDFSKRFNIALGVARGLAYLHEECLEWILHCDVKPQNILLDSNYEPKVADFGLSKLLKRNGDDSENPNFSKIRGTRGYMAPEWVFNLPITSKVDVYSYGIVVLEMVTGKSPSAMGVVGVDGEGKHRWRLVTWVREKKAKASSSSLWWLKEIVDPVMRGRLDPDRLAILVEVALQCVEEDRDARPTMRRVVEMLQGHEND